MQARIHLDISPDLVGEPLELAPGRAKVRLKTKPEMVADGFGLVHGGFTFGLADYAAMLAVNDPNVVLGASESRFLAPVRLGEEMTASAVVEERQGKKVRVTCKVSTDKVVMEAAFTCFVLEKHILAS